VYVTHDFCCAAAASAGIDEEIRADKWFIRSSDTPWIRKNVRRIWNTGQTTGFRADYVELKGILPLPSPEYSVQFSRWELLRHVIDIFAEVIDGCKIWRTWHIALAGRHHHADNNCQGSRVPAQVGNIAGRIDRVDDGNQEIMEFASRHPRIYQWCYETKVEKRGVTEVFIEMESDTIPKVIRHQGIKA